MERAEAEAARLGQEVKQLREQREETRRRLELAQAQLLQQSLPEESQVAPRFFQERPLRGHQYCVPLIALPIGLARRFRIAHGRVLSRSRAVSWHVGASHAIGKARRGCGFRRTAAAGQPSGGLGP